MPLFSPGGSDPTAPTLIPATTGRNLVQALADIVPFQIQAKSAQTADLFGIYNASAVQLFQVTAAGDVSLGTPANPLPNSTVKSFAVRKSSNTTFMAVNHATPSASQGSGLRGYSNARPTAQGHRFGFLAFGVEDSNAVGGTTPSAWTEFNGALIGGFADAAWTNTDKSGYMTFETTPVGTVTRAERLRIMSDGYLWLRAPTAVPGANPPSGGYLFIDANGALAYRGTAGTVTPIAPA